MSLDIGLIIGGWRSNPRHIVTFFNHVLKKQTEVAFSDHGSTEVGIVDFVFLAKEALVKYSIVIL